MTLCVWLGIFDSNQEGQSLISDCEPIFDSNQEGQSLITDCEPSVLSTMMVEEDMTHMLMVRVWLRETRSWGRLSLSSKRPMKWVLHVWVIISYLFWLAVADKIKILTKVIISYLIWLWVRKDHVG